MPKLLENDPNLSLSCSVSGDVLTGIIIKNGLSINDEKEQSVKLLSAPDNNFKNFIYGG